ncbi:MAG: hypothetical protein ACI4JJ_01840 [Huintestinicola sp.]
MFKTKYIKKIAAGMTAAAMLASLTACGEDTTWGAVIDGEQIPAGIFIYYLQSGYYQAQSKLTANEDGTYPDVFTADIEGKDGKTWIYDYATEQMQKYAAIEAKCAEYGVTISDEDMEAAKISVDSTWDYIEQYYGENYFESMGISQDSYLKTYVSDLKYDALFDKLYSPEGEHGVSEDELKAYLDENYAMINYIEMELRDGEGNLLKSEGKAERMAMAEEYVERYKAGESFDSLNAEYVAYYDNLVAQAEAAAAEAEETTDDTSAAETQTAEVETETAEADGAEAEEGETTDTEAVTEVSETDTAENETDEETDEVSEEAEEAASDEVSETSEAAATSEETAEETSEETAEETTESSDEGILSDDISLDDGTVNVVSSNQTVIEKTGTAPSEKVVSAVFNAMAKGDIMIIEEDEYYYIVLKEDVLETDEYFNEARESLLYEMKNEDFEALIKTWEEAQLFTRNEKSYKRYDPAKLFGEE